jgi:hypothetical protein
MEGLTTNTLRRCCSLPCTASSLAPHRLPSTYPLSFSLSLWFCIIFFPAFFSQYKSYTNLAVFAIVLINTAGLCNRVYNSSIVMTAVKHLHHLIHLSGFSQPCKSAPPFVRVWCWLLRLRVPRVAAGGGRAGAQLTRAAKAPVILTMDRRSMEMSVSFRCFGTRRKEREQRRET